MLTVLIAYNQLSTQISSIDLKKNAFLLQIS